MNKEIIHIIKTNRREKFWFHHIRAVNYFCFRYWWLVLLFFIAYLIFWYLFCFRTPYEMGCVNDKLMSQSISSINSKLDSCCGCSTKTIQNPSPPLYIPRDNCRVHFSGLVMGGEKNPMNISEIYKEDEWSEYVGEGEYPDNTAAFPKAVQSTFDGIAVDSGTRLIIYSGKNFSGQILLDVDGPRIINNSNWKHDSRYAHCNTDVYPPELQKTYPQSVREWSKGNMHQWSFGSCKIICSR